MVAFAWATVGSPYPATAAAKVEGGLLGWLAGVREPLAQTFLLRPWAFAREWVAWLWQTNPLLPLALLALPLAWRRRWARARRAWPRAARAPARDGPARPVPGTRIPGRTLLDPPAAARRHRPARWHSTRRPRGFGGRPCALWLLLALWTLWPASERYAWGVQNIDAMQVKLGHWVDANLPPKARLALNDIGAIAYVSRRPVVDLMGLVTPEILPYRREGEDGVIRYVAKVCPDYVIVFPTWFPRLTARTDMLEPLYRVALEARGGLRRAGNGRISAEGLCAMIVSCAARRSSRSR